MFYTKNRGRSGYLPHQTPSSLAAIVFGFAKNRRTNIFSVLCPGMVGTPGPNLQFWTKYIETQETFKNLTISASSP